MNRAQHLRLGLSCPSCEALSPLVPGPLIPVPKLSDLSRCMQVIFNDVCVAWLFDQLPAASACVSHASVVSLFPLAKRR